MQLTKAIEQSIAVFGESGSGKTVLVSSFYGATQEPDFLRESLYDVTAASGQHNRLFQNYLGMKDYDRVPDTTRFDSTSYTFSIKMKSQQPKRGHQFDALRLVWHDYPGQWFEQDVSGEEEERRRVDTFRALLGSDVAFLLVDAQRILDNEGHTAEYLKSLFGNFRNGLRELKDELLGNSGPLVEFPRIWILALSKADLLPNMDVFAFRDLVVANAGADLEELRRTIADMVQAPDALSVGEDFVRLSSAKFEPTKIEVQQKIGLDLILPLAAVLSFERHVRWNRAGLLPAVVAEKLLGVGAAGAKVLAALLLGKKTHSPGPTGLVKNLIGGFLTPALVDQAAELGTQKLQEINAAALADHENLTATLTDFRMRLDAAEAARVLFRSRK